MTEPRTNIKTLVHAMRILACEIQSDDGVANAAIQEAAERLVEQLREIAFLKEEIERLKTQIAPEGWKLVPIEPTEAMRWHGIAALEDIRVILEDRDRRTIGPYASRIYKAMLSAAPKPEEMP